MPLPCDGMPAGLASSCAVLISAAGMAWLVPPDSSLS